MPTASLLREANVSVTLGGLVSGISPTKEQKPASKVWCKRTVQLWGVRRREVKYFSAVARVSAMIRHAFWSSECTRARQCWGFDMHSRTHVSRLCDQCRAQRGERKKKWSFFFQCPLVSNSWVELVFVVVVAVVVILSLSRQAGTSAAPLFVCSPSRGIFPSLSARWTLPKTGQLHSAILTQRLQGADSIIHRLLSGILLTHAYKVYMQCLPHMQMDASLCRCLTLLPPKRTAVGFFLYRYWM